MQVSHNLRAFHRFLINHSFYPLALSSVLASMFFFGRVYMTGKSTFIFLGWNLFLAWLPYLFALWAAAAQQRHPHHWWRLLIPAALWLLFFPNGPYILTDLIHLRTVRPFVLWYDAGLIASFALTGCFLAVASLSTMQQIVRQHLGAALSWVFVLASIGLSGLGVYLGRFVRLNSWDLLFEPRSTLRETIEHLTDKGTQTSAIGVSVMFGAVLLVCYTMFVTPRNREE